MKSLKIFLGIILAGFLLFGFLYINSGIQYGKRKAVWESQKKVLNESISKLEAQIEKGKNSIQKLMDESDEAAKKIADIEKKLKAEKQQHQLDLAKVAELAPDEVVIKTREYLEVSDSEIFLTQLGVQFSLDASYTNLKKLNTLEFTLVIEIPRIEAIMGEQKQEIQKLREASDTFNGTLEKAAKLTADWKKKYEGEYALRKSAEKSFNLFSFKNVFIGGGILAVVVTAIVLIGK